MQLIEATKEFEKWILLTLSKGTVQGYSFILKQFCVFMRNCDIEDIKLEDVITWFSLIQAAGYHQNTIITKAILLKKFFNFYKAKEFKVLNSSLIPVPKRLYELPRVATEEEYKALLAVIPKNSADPRHVRNRVIVMLLWDTGARCGEICSINFEDIDLIKRKVIIKTEKNRGTKPFRTIFWTEETNDALIEWGKRRERLLKKWDMENFFPLFMGIIGRFTKRRLKSSSTDVMLKAYSKKAGIRPVNSHSIRHRKGRHIIERGGSNSDVMNILGHVSLASSGIYTVLAGKELEHVAKKFL